MKAVVVSEYGGVDRLTVVDRPEPEAGPGQLLVQVEAVGVNFMDVYQREGAGAFRPPLPYVAGNEGAGVVLAAGEGAGEFVAGDRIAWSGALGSYAERAVIPAARAVPVPDELSLRDAAAVLLQGVTAHYLSHSAYAVQVGDLTVVHAAAGGVGQLLTQMIVRLGGRVLATVSTPEKGEIALAAGAERAVRYDELGAAVEELSGGEGAHVVYDSVGAATFDASLAALRARGTVVLFGTASGPVPPFDLGRLAAKSAYVTRPTLAHYAGSRADLVARAKDVLSWTASGELRVAVSNTYPLDEATTAHTDLEARRTTGKLLLIP